MRNIFMIMNIDIILVTYNQEKFVQKAIDGIAIQQLPQNVQARVIVADDASEDGTLSIIKQNEASIMGKGCTNTGCRWNHPMSFLYLPHGLNMGHGRNYERAFKEALHSNYIAIIEGDDWWCNPHHLQKRVDFLEEHRECSMASSIPYFYHEESKIFDYAPTSFSYRLISTEEQIKKNLFDNLSSCVLRTSVLNNVDNRIYQSTIMDWPLYVNLSQFGYLALLGTPTSVYRLSSKGLWGGHDILVQEEIDLKLISEIETLFPEYKEWYIVARKLAVHRPKSKKRKLLEFLLKPFVVVKKYYHSMKKIFNEM